MAPEVLVALAALAGTVVTAVAGLMLAVFKAGFDAWRKGDLVSRTIHDEAVSLLLGANKALRDDNAETTRLLDRLTRANEDMARQLERLRP